MSFLKIATKGLTGRVVVVEFLQGMQYTYSFSFNFAVACFSPGPSPEEDPAPNPTTDMYISVS